ncbi:TetR/AcrR family transcriptional regulator [Secundilactobacillus paracollinoides]|uniref:TetR family transcriptional regulator n=1 Tax=Secundilactobacillus paracollinoides TaxID=240427 RepID=A0A1B2IZ98_9LACO|nr:TetR/AcrR family transcriptional regulator [Secundilactobacillus paracollinoides]ANZ61452.1 TetR family transcriptional regulator [Secundilactobacillus paracollinoides]ANZ67373.1 TetR family transcriptional regulator [Secundilactobacillus paracollinoides]
MKREVQLEKTHRAILDEAQRLFLTKGYQDTSTRDIAKAVGITQPALYHHFADKEVIFIEVITSVGETIRERLTAVNEMGQDLTPEDHLIKMSQVLTDVHPRDVFTIIHSSFAYLKPENMQKLGMVFGRDYLAPIAAFFSTPKVKLRAGITPEEAGEFYMTSLSPLFSKFHRLGGKKLTDEEHVHLLIDLILHGLIE